MTFKILATSLLTLSLIGCGSDSAGPKALSTQVEKRGKQAKGADGQPAAPETVKPVGQSWGRVYLADGDSDVDFQNQVVNLLEPQLKKDEVGIVNGVDDRDLPAEEQHNTGIAFWGKGLSLTGGLDPNKTDYAEAENIFDVNSAALRLSIFMGVPNANDKNLVDVQEVPIHFNDDELRLESGQLVDSYINGNFIQLTFADQYGKVSIAGNFNAELFTGQVFFKTDKVQQEGSDELVEVNRNPETLGSFEISTCGFFACTN